MTLLITRPLSDALAMQSALQKEGIAVLIAPMLVMEPCNFLLPERAPEAVVATSRYAFQAAPPPAYRDARLYVVGEQTARAAAEAKGWPAPSHITEDSAALIAYLQTLPATELLYMRGEVVSTDLPAALTQHCWQEITAYRARALTTLPADVTTALQSGEITGVVFYSRRTAELFEHAFPEATQPLAAFCLSPRIAEALKAPYWQARHVAAAPQHEAMMDLIRRIHNRA